MKKSLLLITVLVFIGCSTPTVYISSITEPNYSPLKSDPIIIVDSTESSMERSFISDSQFYSLLKEEMILNGFNIVEDFSSAQYLLAFQKGTKTSRYDSTVSISTLKSSSSRNSPMPLINYSTDTVPYSYTDSVEKIYLILYAPELENSLLIIPEEGTSYELISVWEGYISVDPDKYKTYSRAIIKNLLDVFGTNYTGNTPINTEYGK